MSFTFVAMQSIPIVSQRRISFATRTFVPTLSVHKERAYAPKSTRPVKCPILVSGLPKPRRRYVSAETRAAMCAAFVKMLSQQLAAAAERLQGRPWDRHRTGRHANAQSAEAV